MSDTDTAPPVPTAPSWYALQLLEFAKELKRLAN
jgi:hypothetical protein